MVTRITPWGMDGKILGLQMASKVFTIIYDAELGKPIAPPYFGRNLVRDDNDAAGKGFGKKRMLISNRSDIGICLNPKGC